jgi:hypothetical protein
LKKLDDSEKLKLSLLDEEQLALFHFTGKSYLGEVNENSTYDKLKKKFDNEENIQEIIYNFSKKSREPYPNDINEYNFHSEVTNKLLSYTEADFKSLIFSENI